MDLYTMYLGDSTYFTSYRQSLFRDYEKFPYGTLEGNSKPQKSHYARVQEKIKRSKEKSDKKEPCPICQEQKKRPLIEYIRRRNEDCKNRKITEEAEEEYVQNQHKQQPVTTAQQCNAQKCINNEKMLNNK